MLEYLKINNGDLLNEFNSNIYEYEVVVDDMTTFLIMDYKLIDDGTITIYGNEDFGYGENHVYIEVFTDHLVTYTLKVYKEKSTQVFLEDASNNNSIKNEILNDIKTPGIASICFLLIVIIFSLLFHKKKHKY